MLCHTDNQKSVLVRYETFDGGGIAKLSVETSEEMAAIEISNALLSAAASVLSKVGKGTAEDYFKAMVNGLEEYLKNA